MSNDLASLTSNGNAFQSFGAAQVNDLSLCHFGSEIRWLEQEGVTRTFDCSLIEASKIAVIPGILNT